MQLLPKYETIKIFQPPTFFDLVWLRKSLRWKKALESDLHKSFDLFGIELCTFFKKISIKSGQKIYSEKRDRKVSPWINWNNWHFWKNTLLKSFILQKKFYQRDNELQPGVWENPLTRSILSAALTENRKKSRNTIFN